MSRRFEVQRTRARKIGVLVSCDRPAVPFVSSFSLMLGSQLCSSQDSRHTLQCGSNTRPLKFPLLSQPWLYNVSLQLPASSTALHTCKRCVYASRPLVALPPCCMLRAVSCLPQARDVGFGCCMIGAPCPRCKRASSCIRSLFTDLEMQFPYYRTLPRHQVLVASSWIHKISIVL